MGAKELLLQIADNLRVNQDLMLFCTAIGGREPTVKVSWRNRAEIGMEELPLIMLTSPVTKRSREFGSMDQERTVRVIAGFYQPDPELGALQLMEFEELLAAALEDQSFAGFGNIKDPLTSINDEGSYQPTYFFAGEFTVTVNA